ncbi:ABC transporter permease [Nonomuraea zeae]|uniref:ABC transporter permease n=2 Tax=Nonomuraea zeae TaxID=1642303 RepID=A0A5S4G4J6_9ACTN|nr:ABC transporter permease [Nonomuraea zeae]TMR27772.1 ABC transporter permease [Nonomuraea zeae]
MSSASTWARFLVRRISRLLISVFVLLTAVFAIIHVIPGDPVRAALGQTASPELIESRRQLLGLDQPLWQQYADFLSGLLRGDLGVSMVSGLPAAEVVEQRLAPTLELALYAFLLIMVLAVPIGMTAAVLTQHGRRPRAELGFNGATGALGAIPDFLLAVALIAVFAVLLDWLPAAAGAGARSYVLPVLALSIGPLAVICRLIRVETLRVLGEDFMRTARSKRLPSRLLYLRHALPNLLTSTLTWSGLLLGGLLSGTVLVENVFAWPGLGTELARAVPAKDYPIVQTLALVFGGAVLLINFLVDVLIVMVNPRSALREG